MFEVGVFFIVINKYFCCPKLQADFGFSEHHQNEVINYMRFARSKRLLRLKTIDSCFQELKDSRWQTTFHFIGHVYNLHCSTLYLSSLSYLTWPFSQFNFFLSHSSVEPWKGHGGKKKRCSLGQCTCRLVQQTCNECAKFSLQISFCAKCAYCQVPI